MFDTNDSSTTQQHTKVVGCAPQKEQKINTHLPKVNQLEASKRWKTI